MPTFTHNKHTIFGRKGKHRRALCFLQVYQVHPLSAKLSNNVKHFVTWIWVGPSIHPDLSKILALCFEFNDTPNPGSNNRLDPNSLSVQVFGHLSLLFSWQKFVLCQETVERKAFFFSSETALSSFRKQIHSYFMRI